jgi:hypothetical protein
MPKKIGWELDQWEIFIELDLMFKILVAKELIAGEDAVKTLAWVFGSTNGWQNWVLTN